MNVAAERDDLTSLLTLYRRLIELRRAEPALSVGDYAALPAGNDLMAYIRKADGRRLLIVLNFSDQPQSFNAFELEARGAAMLSTQLDRGGEKLRDELVLRPHEGVIIELM